MAAPDGTPGPPSGLFADLEVAAARYAEVEPLIPDPTVLAGQARLQPLLREYGTLKRRVEPFVAWRKAKADLEIGRAHV